jgi:hypothetical protein
MKFDSILLVLAVLIGLLFYQNILLSKKIVAVWNEIQDVKYVLQEGVCE